MIVVRTAMLAMPSVMGLPVHRTCAELLHLLKRRKALGPGSIVGTHIRARALWQASHTGVVLHNSLHSDPPVLTVVCSVAPKLHCTVCWRVQLLLIFCVCVCCTMQMCRSAAPHSMPGTYGRRFAHLMSCQHASGAATEKQQNRKEKRTYILMVNTHRNAVRPKLLARVHSTGFQGVHKSII